MISSAQRDENDREEETEQVSARKQGGSTVTVYLDGKLRYGAFQLSQKEMGLERWVVLRKNKIHISGFTDTGPSAFAILAEDSCRGLARGG